MSRPRYGHARSGVRYQHTSLGFKAVGLKDGSLEVFTLWSSVHEVAPKTHRVQATNWVFDPDEWEELCATQRWR